MITNYGSWEIKFCVASVYMNTDGCNVSFYAFKEGVYGVHRVSDINDKNIIWYDTEEEAMKNRYNSSDCVLPKGGEAKQEK